MFCELPMTTTLLDTDLLSDFLRRRNPAVIERATKYVADHGRLLTSTVSVFEIVRGWQLVGEAARAEAFMRWVGGCDVLALDVAGAAAAGRVDAALERSGQRIGFADTMIAGIAIAGGLKLATANVEHFARISSLGFALALENWREPP